MQNGRQVFVTGGTGYLGYRVVRALLEAGAQVTVLIKPENEEKLGALRSRVRCVIGDPWEQASLRGRARGHQAIIHLVGGIKPDPTRGLTFRHLNYVSLRNVAQMAVSDGVPHFVFLSASAAPLGVQRGYVESKREAEAYLQSTGLTWTVVRAPTLFVPGERRNPLYALIGLAAQIPLLGMLLSAQRPLAVETAARAIASLALSGDTVHNRLIQPPQLRRLGRNTERSQLDDLPTAAPTEDEQDEPPFGWLP